MALLRFRYPLSLPLSSLSSSSPAHGCRRFRCAAGNQALFSVDATKLVLEVKEKLEREHPNLPVGKNGRDDEDMILWFLKDRKFSVEEAVMKLTKAITFSFQKWHEDFGVSDLCEESVKSVYGTGKAYVHDFLDNNGRPVLVVVASKHFPAVGNTRKQEPIEDEKLCVYLIETALNKLPPGTEEILGIFDLRGFLVENGDVQFLKFLMDVFYYYYPRRLGQVLFVDAPFVFQPIWQLVKPLMRSYASLVRFCDMETVRKEYFTESTVPTDFKD
ncbi:CRAL-TRIO domain-containing protein C3H8.02-like isoform X1 [Musa acuminata AAA Group]|uniref:CRAL-TRIO domain-containing protein C3H8.02-like isoform X1 n=1 Tax=Musa acuminata AAA Group TaxID=214697 RepID=UPI0031E22C7F